MIRERTNPPTSVFAERQYAPIPTVSSSPIDSTQTYITIPNGIEIEDGVQIFIHSDHQTIALDYGAPNGIHDVGGPTLTDGIKVFQLGGQIPTIDGLYREEIPQHNIETVIQILDARGQHDLAETVRIQQDLINLYGFPMFVALTHADTDHYGFIGTFNLDLPLIATPQTFELLNLAEEKYNNWLKEITYSKDRNAKRKGKAGYQRSYRVTEEVYNQTPYHASNFVITPIEINHILGAVAFVVETPNGDRILYTGDIGHGAKTEAFLNYIEGEKFDFAIFDTTNAGKNTEEPYTNLDFKKELLTEIGPNYKNNPIWAILQDKDSYKLGYLLELAFNQNRPIYLPISIAHRLLSLQKFVLEDPNIPDINNFWVYGNGELTNPQYKDTANYFASTGQFCHIQDIIDQQNDFFAKNPIIILADRQKEIGAWTSNGLMPVTNSIILHCTSLGGRNKMKNLQDNARDLTGNSQNFIHRYPSRHLPDFYLRNSLLPSINARVMMPIHTPNIAKAKEMVRDQNRAGVIIPRVKKGRPIKMNGMPLFKE